MWSITKEISSESEPETELKVLDYILSKLITGSFGPSDSRSFLSVHSGLVQFQLEYNLQQFIGLAVQGHVVSGKQHARAL